MKRDFITGSEWLYYKIYCGYGTADELLKGVVAPLSAAFKSNGLIDNWFFIRYADPDPHLRWRLHFGDLSGLGSVELTVAQALQPYMDSKQVNRVATDTYKREIERYGEATMELCERLFGFDSEMVTSMLSIIETMPDKELYRWLFALKAIDATLSDFGYSLEERHPFMKASADSFGKEFGITEFTIKQFSDKYRSTKDKISKFIHSDDVIPSELYSVISGRSEKTKDLVKAFKETCQGKKRLDEIMHSLIHMTMNRIFVAQQRKHEVILYGFLERFYRSELAKGKYCKN
ncbi:MAG: thiopeptide-type bacteriocin biosynthesis protein [Candidatus Limimorpha sp.]